MREFKFIRGIYKNESVLSQDETDGTLFALYKNGEPVSLDIKNNETFQKTIADLKPDNREIYTVRPSQFNATATKMSSGYYTFTYDLDGSVYDNSKKFPDDVKNAAAIRLSTYTDVNMPTDPSLNLEGASPKTTSVEFTYDNKSFTKNLYFRVFGDVAEFNIATADDKNTITAYKMIDGNVSYKDFTTGIFHNGKKQEGVPSTNKSIATYQITVSEAGYLDVASHYKAGTDHKFLINKTQLLDSVDYTDNLNFDLYNKVDMYLTESSESLALDRDGLINPNFVVYRKSNCPNINCYKEGSQLVNVTAYLEDKCETGPITGNKEFYAYYELHEEPAYILKGTCTVSLRNGTIVKDYEASYDKLFIIYTDESGKQELRQIKSTDLNPGEFIDVYTGEVSSYNVFNSNVYKDDPNDKADYVTLSSRGVESITSSNASINDEGDVVPVQDSSTFRQIVESTLRIEATES